MSNPTHLENLIQNLHLQRGGRLTKLAGKTASYTPTMGLAANIASPISRPAKALLLTFGALTSLLLMGSASKAAADICFGGPNIWNCIGTSTTTQDFTGATSITINDPFSLITGVGNGFTLSGGANAVTFIDNTGTSLITAAQTGIYTTATDTITIGTTGTVTGLAQSGIYVQGNDDTSITTGAGAISGGTHGIHLAQTDSGVAQTATITTGSGAVTGSNGSGIRLEAAGGSNQASTTVQTGSGTVSGTKFGIRVSSTSTKAIEITTTGDVTSSAGIGIFAINAAAATEHLKITVGAGQVSGLETGISASNHGSDALEISATGAIIGTQQDGIYAYGSSSSTSMDISVNDVTGGQYGIYAIHEGTGALTISAANVTGGLYGIYATNYGAGSTTITVTGDVTGQTENAIDVVSKGTTLQISTGAGTLTADNDGIHATHSGSGAITITTGTGAIRAQDDGIDVENKGGGDLTITTNGDVFGITDTGIVFKANAAQKSTLNINKAVSGLYDGVRFDLTNGALDLTISTTGSATGGDYAIYGETDGQMTLTNDGLISGLIDAVGNSATSTFTNNGIWRAFGGTSSFTGAFTNVGTLDTVNNAASDKIQTFNLTLDNGSALRIDMGGLSDIDSFKAVGAVAIGGTLDLHSATKVRANSSFKLIDNNTTLDATTGAFSAITSDLAFMTPVIDANGGDNNDVMLSFSVISAIPDFTPFATNINEDALANALASFDYTSTDGQLVLAEFLGQTNTQAQQTLAEIVGTESHFALPFGDLISATFRSLVHNQHNRLYASDGENDALSYAPTPLTAAFDAFGKDGSDPMPTWVAAFASHASQSGGLSLPDSVAGSGGVAAGVETADQLGLSAGLSLTQFGDTSSGPRSTIHSLHAGLAKSWGAANMSQSGWGLSGALDLTYHHYQTEHDLNIAGLPRTASAEFNGYSLGGELKLRYGMEEGPDNLLWAPFAKLNLAQSGTQAYSETGAGSLNLSVAERTDQQASTTLGVEFSNQMMVNESPADIGFSLGWTHEFGDVTSSNTYTLQGSPTPFALVTPSQSRDSLALATDIKFSLDSTAKLTLSAQAEISKSHRTFGAELIYKLAF